MQKGDLFVIHQKKSGIYILGEKSADIIGGKRKRERKRGEYLRKRRKRENKWKLK
jgi:hypothetical protein